MTDPVVDRLEEPWRGLCMPLTHDFEGIGETSTYYVDLAGVPGSGEPPRRSLLRRLAATARLETGGLPYRLGVRRRRPADSATWAEACSRRELSAASPRSRGDLTMGTAAPISGRTVDRDDPGYESARRSVLWRTNAPTVPGPNRAGRFRR